MKITFSHNDNVTIYPNEKGWAKIIELTGDVDVYYYKQTEDGGYRDQLWCIMHDLHEMFYNGQQYFENTLVKIENPHDK